MRIRKNSSKVLGSHSTHYWFMQPSSNSPKNSTEKLPSLSVPIKCEMNYSPWDVLHSVSEQLPDLSYHENEDAKTLDLMENGKKTIEEEPMTVLESASNGSSSLCASKNKRKKKKKGQEEKESTEGMEKDQVVHQRAKRRNSGSRMKVASDFYYFSTAGSWWGRMRKGPKRSRVAVKGTSGNEKDDENVANGVAGHDDDEFSGGEESKSDEVIRSYERKPVEGLPLKFF